MHGGGEEGVLVAGDGDGDSACFDFFVHLIPECVWVDGGDDEALVFVVAGHTGEFGDGHE